ncbi:hypothetical protein HDV64DRAFT_264779 [Trichoderma sp. TUCIM 5745]
MPRQSWRKQLLQAEQLCGIRTQGVDANGWCPLKVPVLGCDQAPNLLHAAHQLYRNNHSPWAQQKATTSHTNFNPIVNDSPRGVALGAKNCLDGSQRESKDTHATAWLGSTPTFLGWECRRSFSHCVPSG